MYPRVAWTSKENLRDNRLLNGGFYQSIRFTLLAFRLTGLLSMSGLFYNTSKFTRCSWKTPYSIIQIPVVIFQVCTVLFSLCDFVFTGFTSHKFTAFFFLSFYLFGSLSCIRLCSKWRTAINEIEAIEVKLPPVHPKKPVFVANVVTFVISFGSAVEHVLYLIFTTETTRKCYLLPDDSGLYLKSYLLSNYVWLYEYISFSYVSGFIVLLYQVQSVFLVNLMVTTIMITSIYLTNRFKKFNRILYQRQYKSCNRSSTWAELQVYYTRITRLAKILDDLFSPFIFVVIFYHLFYTSRQIFYILNKLTRDNPVKYTDCVEQHRFDWEVITYTTYSFFLTLTKLSIISFLAAELHTTSREPLNALYTAPTNYYNMQMQRLMTQIYNSDVCLTGVLFRITRETILTTITTIMTYELVLLQI